MWSFLFTPFTTAYKLMREGAAKAAGAKASKAATAAGATAAVKASQNKLAQAITRSNVDKWTGGVLVSTFGAIGLIGGYLGLQTWIGGSQTAAQVATWLGATADEIKNGTGKKMEEATNLLMGVAIVGALTAIGTAVYVVAKRK